MEVPSDSQSLSQLIERLKPGLPRSSMVRVCARNARNGKLKAKFYADGWPDFTTVVCVIFFPTITEADNILYYSTSKEKLLLVMKEASLITWGRPQELVCELLRWRCDRCLREIDRGTDYLSTDSKYLIENLKPPTAPQGTEEGDQGLVVVKDFIMFHLSGKFKQQNVICPDGFTLGKLEPHHAQYVSEYWPFFTGKPWVVPFMEALITNYDSSAVFVADNPTVPVSWALLYPWGQIANVYTMEAYRRRGLSTAVQSDLCNKVLANGDTPEAMTLSTNEPIIRLLIKQGFTESSRVKILVHSNSTSH